MSLLAGASDGRRRVALVTGGSRGLGRGIAVALGAAGWTVYITGRGPIREGTGLAKTVSLVTDAGGAGIALTCDHRDDGDTERVFDEIAGNRGRLDLLVNNAWSGPPDGYRGFSDPFWERPIDDWDALIGVGLRAHYVASVAACRLMVEQHSGLIVNISSFGTRAHLHSVLYGMSKAGLDKMTSDMAVELAGRDVTVLSLWPGLVRTPAILASGIDKIDGFPIADGESPEFIGRVIAALADDPDVHDRSGSTVISAEEAVHYGITEDDGRQPPSHREAFGGGPIF
ncbi:MAG: SDR family NAD(P)-dependent oxidoreductase [Jatrophihabitantaceae bacterium]